MSTKNLKKSVTFTQAISLVIGMIIGSGIFLKPGIVFRNAGSLKLGIAAWVIGGVISLCSALTIAEIGTAIPKTGGLYAYLEELYGEVFGFLLGWVQTVISYPASGAALAIAFTSFASRLIPIDPIGQKLLASGILIFVILMNSIATKFGGWIQTVSTVGKLIPVVAIIAFGLSKGDVHMLPAVNTITVKGMGFGAAILGTLWAYDGWIGVTNMSGELKNPKKDLPRSVILGVLSVMSIYVVFNLALAKVLPLDALSKSASPVADAAIALFGEKGGLYITIGMMVSVFGALNGYLMTGARVPFAMCERGLLPLHKKIGSTHKRFKTPSNALILEGVFAVLFIMSGSFNMLTDLLVFVLWIFFVMGVAGIFKIRKRKGLDLSGYKVPLYPITPILGIVGGAYIIISTLMNMPMNSLIGIVITLLGLPVYYRQKKKQEELELEFS